MPPTPNLDASVVVPTHNRRDLILRCLRSLEAQTHDLSAFEVVIIDDGSTDGTGEMLEQLETPLRLRVLQLGAVGQSAARNAAIEASESPLCILLDDDVIASPELVAEHVKAHRANDRIAGIGALAQESFEGRDWFVDAFARGWARHYARLEHEPARWPDCYGGNFSASRAALLEVGGFATDLAVSKDIEIGFRLEEHGYQPTYIPLARAIHDDQKPRGRLLADIDRAGSGYPGLAERHPKMAPTLLGSYGVGSPRELALRRLLIALRCPPRLLVALGAAVPTERGKDLWYEFLRKYAFWLAVRQEVDKEKWSQLTRGVPILMYHAFTDGGEPDRFVVPGRSFKRQLRALRALRYEVIGLDRFIDAMRTGSRLPRRAVVLTFDDGYVDNLDVALPILRKRGLPATIFLVSGRLGDANDWTAEGPLAGRPLISAEDAGRTQADGVEIGAHSRNHASLPDAEEGALRDEVEGSREDLEALLAAPVRAFAYPYGNVDDRAMAAVSDAGFEIGLAVDDRRATVAANPVRVPRIDVCGTDSIVRFLRTLFF